MSRTRRGSYGARRQSGFVLVTMAITTAAVLAVAGLAIDLGRVLIVKNETQVYCDSSAIAATLLLDGTTAGVTRAEAAVVSANRWNFGTTTVANPTIRFATSPGGPWVQSPNPASGYTYVRVTATVPVPLYFLPLLVQQTVFNVISTAAAGQVPLTSISRGLAPYTAVSTNTSGPNFGLVVGNSYDIQWPQYNGTRAQCGPSKPDRCFVSPPCTGDGFASQAAVVTSWGANISGYWGDTSNSSIAAEILDVIQLAPLAVGTNIQPLLTSGNKASEAGYLDQRANQDRDTSSKTPAAYLASSTHNGRRLIPVTIVNPINSAQTTVTGFGQFLLQTNGSPSDFYVKTTNGNDGFCAIYMGPYTIGSTVPGAGGTTGAAAVRLVE